MFWKNTFHPFSIQNPKGPNLTVAKMGHGQPRFTIWTNLVVLSHLMLHTCTKFQSNQPSSSGEDFLRFLPYICMVAILAIRPAPSEQIFNKPLPGGCIWNLIEISTVVSKENSFEHVNKQSILVTFGQGHWMNLAFGIHEATKAEEWFSQKLR